MNWVCERNHSLIVVWYIFATSHAWAWCLLLAWMHAVAAMQKRIHLVDSLFVVYTAGVTSLFSLAVPQVLNVCPDINLHSQLAAIQFWLKKLWRDGSIRKTRSTPGLVYILAKLATRFVAYSSCWSKSAILTDLAESEPNLNYSKDEFKNSRRLFLFSSSSLSSLLRSSFSFTWSQRELMLSCYSLSDVDHKTPNLFD